MITLSDIERLSPKTKNEAYSKELCEVTWTLSKMHHVHRGTMFENRIAEVITEETGADVEVTYPSAPWDITVNDNIKIEVKSSLVDQWGSCRFQNVKPNKFNYIVFCWVNPNGIIIKWANSDDVAKFCSKRNCGNNGYKMPLDANENWLKEITELLEIIKDTP